MGKKRRAEPQGSSFKAGKEESTAHEEDTTPEEGSAQESLYSVLGVEKTASQSEIRKAYHRLALRLHPDKNPGDEGAKEKFQTLQHVFSVLSDPEKRSIYDETGSTEDTDLGGDKFNDLYQYYRSMHQEVNTASIEQFEEEYRGSEEELKDLKDLYTRFKGDMNMIFEWMMCSRPNVDSHRFMAALQDAIAAGELKSYRAFKKWAGDVSKKPAPEDPLGKKNKRKSSKGKKPESSGTDLASLIQKRQASRSEALFDSLAKKYGGKDEPKGSVSTKPRNRVAAEPDISEEEFAKIQARILKKKKT